jgi:hypothetical protein
LEEPTKRRRETKHQTMRAILCFLCIFCAIGLSAAISIDFGDRVGALGIQAEVTSFSSNSLFFFFYSTPICFLLFLSALDQTTLFSLLVQNSFSNGEVYLIDKNSNKWKRGRAIEAPGYIHPTFGTVVAVNKEFLAVSSFSGIKDGNSIDYGRYCAFSIFSSFF